LKPFSEKSFGVLFFPFWLFSGGRVFFWTTAGGDLLGAPGGRGAAPRLPCFHQLDWSILYDLTGGGGWKARIGGKGGGAGKGVLVLSH